MYAILYSLGNKDKKAGMCVIRCRHNFVLAFLVLSFLGPTNVELHVFSPSCNI